jgi:hypothetical protein
VLNLLVGGPPNQARLAAALVDRSGAVLWLNTAAAAGGTTNTALDDVRDARGLTAQLFAEWPARGAAR